MALTNVKVAREYLNKYPNLNQTELAWKIIEDLNQEKTEANKETWRSVIQRITKQLKRDGINIESQEPAAKYEVIDDYYSWRTKKGNIHMSVELIDQLFYEFSEKGLNLTQTEIINKHNLQVWEWVSIKNTLWLYKKSNIFSPYTVENTPKEALGAMIEEKMNKLFGNVGFQVEQQYNKALFNKYKSSIKDASKRELELQTLIVDLIDLLPTCEVKVIKNIKRSTEEKTINVFIFDLHFGVENDEYMNSRVPQYNVQTTIDNLKRISDIVNKVNAKHVHVFFGGDIIETFTGLNHMNSFKGVAKGFWGARLVMECYKALVDFISDINNVTRIYSVPGNHDRATESNKVDTDGYINQIIFELVKLSYKGGIDVIYDNKLLSVPIDGINYMMSHGNLKITDMNPAEMILEYGDPMKFNVLVSGHKHERIVKRDTKNFRSMVCPSVCVGNDYSVGSGYLTQPGFIICQNNGKGKPDIMDFAL